MNLVILYSLCNMAGILVPHHLVIYTNAVISKCLSVTVADALANLEEFLIVLNSLFVFLYVIV